MKEKENRVWQNEQETSKEKRHVFISSIRLGGETRGEKNIQRCGFDVGESETTAHIDRLVRRSRHVEAVKQKSERQVRDLHGKRYPGTNSPTAPERHELKARPSHVQIPVPRRQEPVGPELVGLSPHARVAVEPRDVDEEARARRDVETAYGAVHGGLARDRERRGWV